MADDTSAQSAFGTPPPDPELRRLEPLVGTWKQRVEDRTRDSVLGPGVPVASTESFYWLDGGYFLVQTYETTFGDDPAQKGVNYWYYDSDAERFRIIFFSNNGPFTEDGNRYQGELTGQTLTLEGPARFQYELDDDGRIKLSADGTIRVAWWLRDDNGEWEPWMTNTFMSLRSRDDQSFVREAVRIACVNADRGEQPFGALVVRDGCVVGTGVSTILRDDDPTAHAEVAAVRDACRSLGTLDLRGATLACSCEPCPMCHAAAVLAGISRIVYGATKDTAARHGFALSEVAADMQATWRAKRLDPVDHVPTEGADEPFVRFDERART